MSRKERKHLDEPAAFKESTDKFLVAVDGGVVWVDATLLGTRKPWTTLICGASAGVHLAPEHVTSNHFVSGRPSVLPLPPSVFFFFIINITEIIEADYHATAGPYSVFRIQCWNIFCACASSPGHGSGVSRDWVSRPAWVTPPSCPACRWQWVHLAADRGGGSGALPLQDPQRRRAQHWHHPNAAQRIPRPGTSKHAIHLKHCPPNPDLLPHLSSHSAHIHHLSISRRPVAVQLPLTHPAGISIEPSARSSPSITRSWNSTHDT